MKKFLIIGLVILFLVPIYIVQTKKRSYENKIEHFLTEEMSYVKEDIQSIEGKWHLAGLPSYWVNVIFSDEPNIVYIYFAHDNVRIGQYDYNSIDSTILSTDKLKHYEPYE
ncbi:DUF3139 domain-containing protein [Bacillus sp. FJAT-22090]|uniref:DUF3139 domain-containing protein n=1 Tax=Bacillus sp. FJAT-22090 TaxID=1581038 RepID=UPI0006ADA3D7|nr:DUF3139 domain-containing protein [Bacillus sp. FJAT-22090]